MRQECYLEVMFSSTVRDQRKTRRYGKSSPTFAAETVAAMKDCNPVIHLLKDSPLSWYFSITL